jgi:MinD superfamily P-loop ATPase
MTIAVASGKGGTGKTTIAVSLAMRAPGRAILLDCDVEEPNAALFLRGTDARETPVTVPCPLSTRSHARDAGPARGYANSTPSSTWAHRLWCFPSFCHSCGGCALACPAKAIREEPSPIGILSEMIIDRGSDRVPLNFAQGLLSIGKAMSPPVIRAVKSRGAELAGSRAIRSRRLSIALPVRPAPWAPRSPARTSPFW